MYVRRFSPGQQSDDLEEHIFEDGICLSCSDDLPDGPLDEDAQALLAAISELVPGFRAGFDAAVHPRNPKGSPGGGRFRSNVDKLKDALKAHKAGKGDGDPFAGFDREQLRRVAKARGIELKRGEGRDSIASKLMAHLDDGEPAAAPEPKPAAKKPAVRKPAAPRKPRTPAKKADGGRAELSRVVEQGKVRHEDKLSGGLVGDTRLRVYDDGTRTVWKKSVDYPSASAKHQADAEELAPLVAQALGLRAPAVVRDGADDTAVHMAFVADAKPQVEFERVDNGLAHTDEGRMMGLLDLLISNGDRNRGNVMIPDDGSGIIPIDHGLAWRYLDEAPSGKPDRMLLSDFTAHYFKPFNESWVDNDLTPGDVAEARRRIERHKADFDRLGRGDWYEHMVGRLDAIAPHAKGTVSRLPAEVT